MRTKVQRCSALYLVCVAATLLMATASVAEIDMATAVGIWLFDEGKGDTTKDISGLGNDGKLVKSPAWVEGKFGSAMEFNGKDNCVDTEQKLLDSLQEFTIMCWVKTGNVVAGRVGLVGQNDSPEFGFIDPGNVNLWTPTAGGLSNPWKFGHPSEDWHHVGAVADGKGTRVYIDGEAIAGGSPGNHGTSAFNVHIGGCGVWDGDGNWFTGAIDEVAIFHSALDDDDFKTLMEGFNTLLAVEARGKLTLTWGELKVKR